MAGKSNKLGLKVMNNDAELDILIAKLEKYQKLSMAWGKALCKAYMGMWAQGLQFGLLAWIFFYIYKAMGRDFCFVLIALALMNFFITQQIKASLKQQGV